MSSEREALANVAQERRATSEPVEYALTPEIPRILIADDEKGIREILSDFLNMEGYLVHTVEDGAEAIKELRRRSYNLVIYDLKLS